MTPCLEFEGKNVDKAIEIACAELKIPKEKLKYDIISYGSSGIFGLVAVKKAKIKVTLNDKPATNKREKKNDSNREKTCCHCGRFLSDHRQLRHAFFYYWNHYGDQLYHLFYCRYRDGICHPVDSDGCSEQSFDG